MLAYKITHYLYTYALKTGQEHRDYNYISVL